jgi:hypothetical protein
MIEADPRARPARRLRRPSERATWEAVAILIVLAVVLALAADGAGLITR